MINLKSIPTNPGCYLYKDSSDKIIYVGKAKNLKKRVSSYFNKKDHDSKTQQLVKNIKDIEFIITNTEIEALLLENNLIKKHKPKYNIDLKDSKRYAYLELTNEKYPRLLISRTKDVTGTLFGPFTSADKRDNLRKTVNETFKLRTCKTLPKKACLRFYIGLCDAPCIENITLENYLLNVNNAKLVLKGHSNKLITKLKEDMTNFSKKLNFEKALSIRNQIYSLESLNEKQNVELNKTFDEDIINYKIVKDKVYLILFNIYKGILENKQEFIFDYTNDFLDTFLTQYYDTNIIPKEIILKELPSFPIEEFLTKKKGSIVKLIVPKTGSKKELLDLVEKNIELNFFNGKSKLDDLQNELKLNDSPKIMECFDISHLSGTNTVASMVQFIDGVPSKQNYRRFKIQSVKGIDDFKAIYEVVYRRYSKLKKENLDMPNLIIIDGGKGQLSFALKALKKLELKIPIISLAKREEEVFIIGNSNPLILKEKGKALLLLKQIRDEAHRFAIKYNRLLRNKSFEN